MPALPSGTVTFLFTDVEASTRLWERDPDGMGQALRRHDAIIESLVGQHGGTVVRPRGEGDSRFAAFSRATQAVAAAAAIEQALRAEPWPTPTPLRVRMALHTGEADLRHGDYYGSAVNRCARLRASAQPGQALISRATHDLVRDQLPPGVSLRDLGERALKDLQHPEAVFELVVPEGPSDVATADALPDHLRRGPLIGRAADLARAVKELDLARAGALRVLAVAGEAGIGKTRFLAAIAETAAERGLVPVYVAADEEIWAPFMIARALVTAPELARARQAPHARESLDRAQAVLTGGEPPPPGLTVEEQRLHLLDTFALALRAVATRSPLALLLDDLHWSDEASLQALRYLARVAATSPILLVLALRPEDAPETSAAGRLVADLARTRGVQRVRLERLERAETGQLLERLIGGPVTEGCAAELHARSEGVPFFVEELARALGEAGGLHCIDGIWRTDPEMERLVPPGVRALLERRLARRPAETRAALAIAALLGRAFRLADLVAVLKHATGEAVGEDELARRLAPALEARLLVELPEGSDEDYRFAHDQVRDVLTASLGRHGRRAIHGAIVAALAGRMVALAQHAIAAGEVEPGVRYACRAAEAALTAQAPEEALRVVDLARPVASGPPDRVALLRLRDDALARLQRDQERLATLAELAALSSALGDELLALDVMLRRAAVARALGDGPGAAELAGAARRAAEQRADRGLELRACLELGQALLGSPVGESFQPVPLRPDGGLLSGLDRALLALLPRGGNPVGAGAPAR